MEENNQYDGLFDHNPDKKRKNVFYHFLYISTLELIISKLNCVEKV